MTEITPKEPLENRLFRLTEYLANETTILMNALHHISKLPDNGGNMRKDQINAIITEAMDKISKI